MLTALLIAAKVSHGFAPGLTGLSLLAALTAVPGIAGVFVGAPLLARDVERHTHWLVWTQGMPRARWTTIKLLLVFAIVLAAAAAVGAIASAFIWTPNQPDVQHW